MKTLNSHRAAVVSIVSLLMIGALAGAAEPIPLRAGPVSLQFDADNAMLRYVKVGSHEILRGVNAPVRDRNWGTVRPRVSNVRVDDGGDRFTVTFDAECREGDIDFRWQGKILGTRAGEVEFSFDGIAHTTFLRNRIGLCVLHPASAAGKAWRIRHVDGRESQGAFPTHIAPHQPAKEIRAISHEIADKLWAQVEMEGDVFEMEDQRNWTDASFKTYCTPLELPFPVKVDKGTRISHKVRLRVEGAAPSPTGDRRVVLALGKAESRLPKIGLQVSSESSELSPRQIERLKELRLDHVRVDLDLASDTFAVKLRQADRQGKALNVPLHVGIRLGDKPEAELQRLTAELAKATPNVAAYLVHVTDWRQFHVAAEALREVRGKARVGATRGANFVDLNRDRPSVDRLDLVAYPINPQIHAFDDASIVETLPIHAETVSSARQFLGKRLLAVGPITLRPPLADPSVAPATNALPADVDARQSSKLIAAWTLGSLSSLAGAGTDSATYFETVGWKGVMDAEPGTKRPAGFPAAAGDVFPVYHVFREMAESAEGQVRPLDSSDALAVVGLALRSAGEWLVLVANLTGHPQTVTLKGLGKPKGAGTLVGENSGAAASAPPFAADAANGATSLVLPPSAIVRVAFADP
ncbi:MAG: hypothetical protein DCC68_03185 [Planctomycetota bacterium]|nr:MAG: hypothetical protein DCC68_03185 [Planctomycetota bacterium]